MTLTRNEIISQFEKRITNNLLLGSSAGNCTEAIQLEKNGIDFISIFSTEKYRTAGSDPLAGMLSFGDANQIVMEMGYEIVPMVKNTPILAGVCGTDPFRVMDVYLQNIKQLGYSGVQNFPSVGLFDGIFRDNLEETGISYSLEVEMIHTAHMLDLFTCPFVFCEDDAKNMALAGADCIIIHLGLITYGEIGTKTILSLDDQVRKIQEICNAGKAVNSDVIVFCQSDTLVNLQEIHTKTTGISGFFETTNFSRFYD